MSADAKPTSELYAVQRERIAFVEGARWWSECGYTPPIQSFGQEADRARIAEARKRFPLTVTRPRVVTDPHGGPKIQWSTAMQFGRIRITYSNGDGFELYPTTGHTAYPTPDRVALWADLLANPTEEIAE